MFVFAQTFDVFLIIENFPHCIMKLLTYAFITVLLFL